MQLALLTTVADESRTMLSSGLTARRAGRQCAPLRCRSSRRRRSPVYPIPVSPRTPDPARGWTALKIHPVVQTVLRLCDEVVARHNVTILPTALDPLARRNHAQRRAVE